MTPQYHRILIDIPDIGALLDVLGDHPHLWNQHPIRTKEYKDSPHAQVDDILLRFQESSAQALDVHESVDWPAYVQMPEFRRVVMSVFAYVGGDRLGRVLVTRLKPGGKITPHVDAGIHSEYYDRFHLCLQADEGSRFRILDEWIMMYPGELWWVNNAVEHEVVNEGQIDRIHLIIDAHCVNWVQSVYPGRRS